jgi:hypothetical protein
MERRHAARVPHKAGFPGVTGTKFVAVLVYFEKTGDGLLGVEPPGPVVTTTA